VHTRTSHGDYVLEEHVLFLFGFLEIPICETRLIYCHNTSRWVLRRRNEVQNFDSSPNLFGKWKECHISCVTSLSCLWYNPYFSLITNLSIYVRNIACGLAILYLTYSYVLPPVVTSITRLVSAIHFPSLLGGIGIFAPVKDGVLSYDHSRLRGQSI